MKKNTGGNSKAARGGDTGRTSSQGRKLASGGHTDNPELDDTNKSQKADQKKSGNLSKSRSR